MSQFSVHSVSEETSLTNTRLPEMVDCAQVALSATVYRLSGSNLVWLLLATISSAPSFRRKRRSFSEAAVGFLRNNPQGQAYLSRLEKKHGKAKALTALAHKLGRAVYYMLHRQEAFDMKRFLSR